MEPTVSDHLGWEGVVKRAVQNLVSCERRRRKRRRIRRKERERERE